MRFAAGPRALMPDVVMRLILDLEPGRRQTLGQLLADRVGDGHAVKVMGAARVSTGTARRRR